MSSKVVFEEIWDTEIKTQSLLILHVDLRFNSNYLSAIGIIILNGGKLIALEKYLNLSVGPGFGLI